MTLPSRDFLVRQAVLNFLAYYIPITLRVHGASYSADWLLGQSARCGLKEPIAKSNYEDIRAQFRKLVAQYEVTP